MPYASRKGRISCLIEPHILDDALHGHAGTAQAHGVFHPADGRLVIIADAACCSMHLGDDTDLLVIAKGIGRQSILAADLPDRHIPSPQEEYTAWSSLQVKRDIDRFVVKMCEALRIIMKPGGMTTSAAAGFPGIKAYTVYGYSRDTVYAFVFFSTKGDNWGGSAVSGRPPPFLDRYPIWCESGF